MRPPELDVDCGDEGTPPLKLQLFTWNHGHAPPDAAEHDWLPEGGDGLDLVVVGSQEALRRNRAPSRIRAPTMSGEEEVPEVRGRLRVRAPTVSGEEDSTDSDEEENAKEASKHEASQPAEDEYMDVGAWEQMVLARLGPSWEVCKHVALADPARYGDMRLTVYAPTRHMAASAGSPHRIHSIESERCPTGLLGVGGNKGGLVVKLCIGDTSFAFCSAHLAAHLHNVSRRHRDASEILRKSTGSLGHRKLDFCSQFDHVFWMGDLNYRVDVEDFLKFHRRVELPPGSHDQRSSVTVTRQVVGEHSKQLKMWGNVKVPVLTRKTSSVIAFKELSTHMEAGAEGEASTSGAARRSESSRKPSLLDRVNAQLDKEAAAGAQAEDQPAVAAEQVALVVSRVAEYGGVVSEAEAAQMLTELDGHVGKTVNRLKPHVSRESSRLPLVKVEPTLPHPPSAGSPPPSPPPPPGLTTALPPLSGTLASLVGHLTSTVAGSTLAVEHGASADSTAEGATASFEELVALIEAGRQAEMLEADQLRRALQHGDVLSGFTEGNVAAFAPTFKVRRRPGSTYKVGRTPSWCDRILWKSMPAIAANVRLTLLRSLPAVSTSDHKPVTACFDVVPSSRPPMVPPTPSPRRARGFMGYFRPGGGAGPTPPCVIRLRGLVLAGIVAADTGGTSDAYCAFFTNPMGLIAAPTTPTTAIRQRFRDVADDARTRAVESVGARRNTYTDAQLPLLPFGVDSADALRRVTLIVALFDRDVLKRDDPLGTVLISLAPPAEYEEGASEYELHVDEPIVLHGARNGAGRLSVTLTVSMGPHAAAAALTRAAVDKAGSRASTLEAMRKSKGIRFLPSCIAKLCGD